MHRVLMQERRYTAAQASYASAGRGRTQSAAPTHTHTLLAPAPTQIDRVPGPVLSPTAGMRVPLHGRTVTMPLPAMAPLRSVKTCCVCWATVRGGGVTRAH